MRSIYPTFVVPNDSGLELVLVFAWIIVDLIVDIYNWILYYSQ